MKSYRQRRNSKTDDPRSQRRSWTAFLLFTPFLASIAGAYAWFVGLPSPASSLPTSFIWLEATTNIPGYTFIPESVSDSVKAGLGTTNILSGTFFRDADTDGRKTSDERPVPASPRRDKNTRLSTLVTGRPTPSLDSEHSPLDTKSASRVTVFLASWTAETKAPLKVLGHTPDICWVGSGWKPVRTENPQRILIQLPIAKAEALDARRQKRDIRDQSNGALTFETRSFELSDSGQREHAAWCILVEGEIVNDTLQMTDRLPLLLEEANRGRFSHLGEFCKAVQDRFSVRGAKQYIRFSVPGADNTEHSIASLGYFASQWLKIRS